MSFDLKTALRAYRGYRLLFKGSPLKLDNDFIPVIKYRESPKDKRAFYNLQKVFGAYGHRSYAALMVSAILQDIELPSEYGHVTDEDGDKIRQAFNDLLSLDITPEVKALSDDMTIWDLTNNLSGTPAIIQMVLKKQITPWTYLKFCSEVVDVPPYEYDYSNSLLYGSKKQKLDALYALNINNQIWKDYFSTLIES